MRMGCLWQSTRCHSVSDYCLHGPGCLWQSLRCHSVSNSCLHVPTGTDTVEGCLWQSTRCHSVSNSSLLRTSVSNLTVLMRNPPFRHRHNYNEPGHAHELTFTCYQRFQFFKAERICHWLAESIDEARKKFHFSLWAFVFMPEHVHLIVYPQNNESDIAEIKKAIKEPVG